MPRRGRRQGGVAAATMEEEEEEEFAKPAVDEFVESVLDLGEGDGEPGAPAAFKSKNLDAERRRRGRLNKNILELRKAVPNITKMSKEATLTDAIEHIRSLQNEALELQNLLAGEPEAPAPAAQVTASSSEAVVIPPEDIQCQSLGHVELIHLGSCKYHLKMFYTNKIGLFARVVQALGSYNAEVTSLSTVTFFGCAESVFSIEVNGDREAVMVQLRGLLCSILGAPGN